MKIRHFVAAYFLTILFCSNPALEQKSITFGTHLWHIKKSDTPVGPGPNYFGSTTDEVRVDNQGFLHLNITNKNFRRICAEIYSDQSSGYGHYKFVISKLDRDLTRDVVLGLFTWDDRNGQPPDDFNREIDFETSHWGTDSSSNSQFVVQPWSTSGNLHRFPFSLIKENVIVEFNWQPGRVDFQLHTESKSSSISWSYSGSDVPTPGNEKVHINYWIYQGVYTDLQDPPEIVINSFSFY